MSTIEGFWARVEKTENCWLWQGAKAKHGGFGICYVDGKVLNAHRFVYELNVGPIPVKMQVFHSCENLHCVNPAHLFLDTKNSHQPLVHKKKREEDRFWSKVQKLSESQGGCWVWTGAMIKGYGAIWRTGKNIRATSLSWEMYTGRPVPSGIHMCHTCDHPYCVNPHHLFLGTTQDNTQDKVIKGRQAKGDKHGLSKLTKEDVIAIVSNTTNTNTELGKMYGVARTTIASIRKGRTWSWLTGKS